MGSIRMVTMKKLNLIEETNAIVLDVLRRQSLLSEAMTTAIDYVTDNSPNKEKTQRLNDLYTKHRNVLGSNAHPDDLFNSSDSEIEDFKKDLPEFKSLLTDFHQELSKHPDRKARLLSKDVAQSVKNLSDSEEAMSGPPSKVHVHEVSYDKSRNTQDGPTGGGHTTHMTTNKGGAFQLHRTLSKAGGNVSVNFKGKKAHFSTHTGGGENQTKDDEHHKNVVSAVHQKHGISGGDWWDGLSDDQKKKYIAAHPNTKRAK